MNLSKKEERRWPKDGQKGEFMTALTISGLICTSNFHPAKSGLCMFAGDWDVEHWSSSEIDRILKLNFLGKLNVA
jgi:hypothetical protein